MRMGSHAMQQAAIGTGAALQVDILPRRALGVQYPAVDAELLPLKPVGLLGTDVSLDNTRATLAQVAVALARLAETEIALERLMSEQRKAQKRVNALRYNIIPRYKAPSATSKRCWKKKSATPCSRSRSCARTNATAMPVEPATACMLPSGIPISLLSLPEP